MQITIVGGGFGGVKAALELAKKKNAHITLITDKPDFQYYPALYSAATGHSHLQAWIPLGEIFAGHDNVNIVLDSITKLDKATKSLVGASGTRYTYHTLILALGSVTTYFGIKGLDQYAYGIKSASEIAHLKEHLIRQFQHKGSVDKNIIVIGAGPTGVELASSLGIYLKELKKHFKQAEPRIKISIVEASPRVLPRMNQKSSALALKRLKKLGVHVELNKKVEEQTVDGLVVNGQPIKTQTVIWTSGVANSPFFAANADQFEFSPNHKVIVDKHLRSGHDVYVIGDNAFTTASGLAQTALKDGKFVADHILGLSKKMYVGKFPPVVVPVGDKWALFEYKNIRFAGLAGSMMRSAADLLGYRDILPVSQALSIWRSQKDRQDDYFPTPIIAAVDPTEAAEA